jgi:hypothetical protein
MAMGGGAAGFVYFIGVKAIGYTAAAPVLKRAYGLPRSSPPRIVTVGLTRTAIGILAGSLYGALWVYGKISIPPLFFFALLLPIRLGEWLILIRLFFDKALERKPLLWKALFAASGWSYCLDALGVLAAFVLPGGFWVC